jgi:hypothetical protein
MKCSNYLFAVLASAVFCLAAPGALNAQIEEPIGPPKPVVVTNTTANPVPVTGQLNIGNTPTVDARQSGSWIVGINGTPTVKLDPTANTVQFTPRGTKLVFDSGVLIYSEDGTSLTFGPLDISAYSKIRLGVNNMGFHDIDIIVRTALVDSNPHLGNAFSVDRFSVEDSEGDFDRGGPSVSKLYEVVGTKLFVTVSFRGQTEGQYRIAVFGN